MAGGFGWWRHSSADPATSATPHGCALFSRRSAQRAGVSGDAIRSNRFPRTATLIDAGRDGGSNPGAMGLIGWDHQDPLIAPDQLPATLMDRPVVAIAEQDEVLQVGRPAVAPVDDVVGVGPGSGAVAARPHAALVANPERGPGSIAGQTHCPSHLDDRLGRTEPHP